MKRVNGDSAQKRRRRVLAYIRKQLDAGRRPRPPKGEDVASIVVYDGMLWADDGKVTLDHHRSMFIRPSADERRLVIEAIEACGYTWKPGLPTRRGESE